MSHADFYYQPAAMGLAAENLTQKQMKKVLLCALALLTMAGIGTAQNLPSYVPANGLVGWWPFNGNANDESGNANNGTVNGATLTADRFGNAGKAYSFDGVNDFIDINESNLMKPVNAISISLWAYIDSTGNGPFLSMVSKYVDLGPSYYSYQMITGNPGFNQTGDAGITVRTNNIYMWTGVTNTSFLNKVHHLVGTYDGSTLKCYKNGVLVSTVNATGEIQYSSSNIFFGRNVNANGVVGSDYYFKGTIDDIAIYNRALGQQEITALYQGGNTTANCLDLPSNLQQGLVGYWPFCGNADVTSKCRTTDNSTINRQKRRTKMPTLRKIKRGVLPTHLPTQKHHI